MIIGSLAGKFGFLDSSLSVSETCELLFQYLFSTSQNLVHVTMSVDTNFMVATGQEMVREKKFFKVREMSGNFILGQAKLAF